MPNTRTFEHTIEIDAPLEEVWRALTVAEEAQRWLAPDMKIEPGVGGRVTVSWGPGMEGSQLIEVWEPQRHLRLAEEHERSATYACQGQETVAATPARLAVDYFLEARGGKTILRLVHSGFGADASWDGEYEATGSGWIAMLRTMKFGLERHPGVPARNLSFFHTYPAAQPAAVLRHLLSVGGFRSHALDQSETGFTGVVPDWNDALLVLSASPGKDGAVSVYAGVVVYGLDAERVARLEADWQEWLARPLA